MSLGGKMWAGLSVYESTELVGRFVASRTEKKIDDARAREIAAYFSQGREYFRSAAGAGELVRPLILYYGAVALARGTVLFLQPAGNGVKPSHGLRARDWEDLNDQPSAVPQVPLEVGKQGTFPELWRATGNEERCAVSGTVPTGVLVAESPGTEFAAARAAGAMTLREVLGQIPDVAELYEKTFEEHPGRLRCEVQATGTPEHWVVNHVPEIPDDQDVRLLANLAVLRTPLGVPPRELVPEELPGGRLAYTGTQDFVNSARNPAHRSALSHHFDLFYEVGSRKRPRLSLPVATLPDGDQYLKLPTESGVVLSTLLALHVVAFAASTLVRYHPGYWAMLIGRTRGDSIAPVLSAAIAAVEERYPALILEAVGG